MIDEFKRLKIADKLLVMTIISLAFTTAIGLVGFVCLTGTANAMQDLYNNRVLPIVWTSKMDLNVQRNKSDILSMMLTNNSSTKQQLMDNLAKRKLENNSLFEKYTSIKLDPEETAQLSSYKEAVLKWREVQNRTTSLSNLNKNSEAYSYFSKNINTEIALENEIAGVSEYNKNKASEINSKNIHLTNIAKTVLLVTILSAFLLLTLLCLVISRMITGPLKQSIAALKEETNDVAITSGEIETISQQLAEDAMEQAASIQETSSTLEETSSMVQQNNNNTKQAAVLARNTKNYAEKSNQEMHSMMLSMENLKQSSHEIAKIIKVIDEIAFQTNLLSLNAAVEAARAGDVGKGFAVVAEEVRHLAQRSAQAAKDTAAIIESNISLSDDSAQIAATVNDALVQIDSESKKVSELLEEIATATDEQSKGINEINKAIQQMEYVMQSNASIADQCAASSNELTDQSGNVNDIVGSLVGLVEGSKGGNIMLERSRAVPVQPRITTQRNHVEPYFQNLLPKQNQGSGKRVLITWNDSYSVGIMEMDNQHKQLISILNELYDAMQSQKTGDIIGQIINRLVSYTKTHFSNEEDYMRRNSYPDFAKHIKEHNAFTKKVMDFKDEYDSGRTSLSVGVTSFIKDWLMNHICVNDKKYGSYFNSQGLY